LFVGCRELENWAEGRVFLNRRSFLESSMVFVGI